MTNLLYLLPVAGVIIFSAGRKWYTKKINIKRHRLMRKEEARLLAIGFFERRLFQIKTEIEKLNGNLIYEKGYFNHNKLVVWKRSNADLSDQVRAKDYKSIGLIKEQTDLISSFLSHFDNCEALRNSFNKKFVAEELEIYKSFFADIEGHGLDLEQQLAVVTNEDNNLVIAGAGTGKTTTIVGKVKYVLDRYKTNPENILVISYTNKSAKTLRDRVNINDVQVSTFHRLGLDIIESVDGVPPGIFEDRQFKPLIRRIFNELMQDIEFSKRVVTYFTNYLKIEKPIDKFSNQGEYIQHLKDQNFKAYKELTNNGLTTYGLQVVKSIEECKIANFLLFNSVGYHYEMPYQYDGGNNQYRRYRPDFTLVEGDKTLYLEHFGINRDGSVPDFFRNAELNETLEQATKRYTEGINWKRELHLSNETDLIESYSYEMSENILFDNLAKNLQEHGIVLRPKSPDEVWNIIKSADTKEVDKMLSLFGTFITLLKSNRYSIEQAQFKNKTVSDPFLAARNNLFLEILKPIYDSYEAHLNEYDVIDFNDMINRATSHVEKGLFYQNFDYIIIDEFQDISLGRYQLLKAFKARYRSCKLFCVGDDWQSIYRFAGSDISLFKHFEKYFGFTEKSKISTTYRFGDPLIEISSKFIQKNINQEKKELKSNIEGKETSFNIQYYNQDRKVSNLLKELFDIQIEKGNFENKTVLILGRYNNDLIGVVDTELGILNAGRHKIKYSTCDSSSANIYLKADFMTVHKSKGLQADIVIVLNCNSGKYGFPSELTDDPVLNLVLSQADQFENGEERRLFYVALTRAKESVYLFTDGSNKSKFVTELEKGNPEGICKKCPKCVTANLRLVEGVTNNKSWSFWGCQNFSYGCDYKDWIN